MMFIPGLAVIFAGLLVDDDVDAQLDKVMRDLDVKVASLPAPSVQKLTHHSDATRPLVRSLHADGVIACELVKKDGVTSLRVVIYQGDGQLKTFSEVPLAGKRLTRTDLETLRSNLADDVADMRGSALAPTPEIDIYSSPPSPPAPPPTHDDEVPPGTDAANTKMLRPTTMQRALMRSPHS